MKNSNKTIRFLFLIVVFLSLRLYKISQPLIEMHSVRQTQTAMVTRNIVKDDFNLLYTRVDWRGDQPGYVVLEFPLYQAIVAFVWKVLGNYDIYGRLVSLFFSIICAIYLYRIARKLFSEIVAYWAVFFFAICPLSIFMSRAFMINMTSLSLSLIGFYYCLDWFDNRKIRPFVIASVSLILATLVNNPISFPLFIPLLYLSFINRENNIHYYISLTFFLVIFSVTLLFWSKHLAHVNNIYFPEWGLQKSLQHFFAPQDAGRLDPYNYFRTIMYLLYFVLGVHGLIMIIGGVKNIWKRKTDGSRILMSWFCGGLLYYLVFFKALSGHNYYWLPIVPIFCLFIGVFVEQFIIRYRVRRTALLKTSILVFTVTLFLWVVLPVIHSTEPDNIAYQAGIMVKNYSEPQDLILVATLHTDVAHRDYPTILYYAERKGWNIASGRSHPFIDTMSVDSLRSDGAKFLVLSYGKSEYRRISSLFPLFKYFSHDVGLNFSPIIEMLRNRYEVVTENNNYILFRIVDKN